MTARRRLFGLAFVLLLVAPAAFAQAYVEGASSFISGLADRAVATLQDPAMSHDEKQRRFREILHEAFAVKGIARFVLGRYWRTATPEQQAEYLDLFESLIIETWSARFEEYTGLNFEVTGARPVSSGLPDENVALVGTTIDGGQGRYEVDWRVSNRDQLYLITDVLIEGVSLANTHREEFGSVVRREGGVDGLLEFMRAKRDGTNTADMPR